MSRSDEHDGDDQTTQRGVAGKQDRTAAPSPPNETSEERVQHDLSFLGGVSPEAATENGSRHRSHRDRARLPHDRVYRRAPRLWETTGQAYHFCDMVAGTFLFLAAVFFVIGPFVRLAGHEGAAPNSLLAVGAVFFSLGASAMLLKSLYGQLWMQPHVQPTLAFVWASTSFLVVGVAFLVAFVLDASGVDDQSSYWALFAGAMFFMGGVAFVVDVALSGVMGAPIVRPDNLLFVGVVLLLISSVLFWLSAFCDLPNIEEEDEEDDEKLTLKITDVEFCSPAAVVWFFLFAAIGFLLGAGSLLGFGTSKAMQATKRGGAFDPRNQAVEGAPFLHFEDRRQPRGS